MIVSGIKYKKVNGQVYEMLLFEEKEIESYASRMIDVVNGIYDCVEWESDVEREFAETMSDREDIKLLIKLPDWFKVETPIGTYNPDWASSNRKTRNSISSGKPRVPLSSKSSGKANGKRSIVVRPTSRALM